MLGRLKRITFPIKTFETDEEYFKACEELFAIYNRLYKKIKEYQKTLMIN